MLFLRYDPAKSDHLSTVVKYHRITRRLRGFFTFRHLILFPGIRFEARVAASPAFDTPRIANVS